MGSTEAEVLTQQITRPRITPLDCYRKYRTVIVLAATTLGKRKIMSWIKEISEIGATGDLKIAYEQSMRSSGNPKVGNILKVFSLRPDLLKARMGFASAMTFGGSGLGRRKEELIATSISGLLNCKY